MKKENYEKPEAEIIVFEPRDVITDVITDSNPIVGPEF